MKKKYLYLAAGMLAAASLGFVSCGDDDEDFHKNDKQEQKDEDEEKEEAFDVVLSQDGIAYGTGYVEVGKTVTITPYASKDSKLTSLKEWDLEEITYDKKFINLEKKRNSAGDLASFDITGLDAVEESIITLTATVDGKKYTAKFTLRVLGDSKEDQEALKDAKRREELKSYWMQQQPLEGPVDITYTADYMPEFVESKNGLLRINKTLKNASNPFDNAPSFRPINTTNIYPGSIIYIDDKVAKGETPDPVFFNAENSLGTATVYIRFLGNGAEMYRDDVPLQEHKIQEAIDEILRGVQGKAIAPAQVEDHSSYTNSQKKVGLDINCSAEFAGAKLGVKTESNTESTKFYSIREFTQGFFTVRIEPKNADRTTYLGKDVTVDVYKKQIVAGNGRKIGIVKSVTYGRWAYYKKVYESSSFNLTASENASYKKYFDAEAKQDISQLATSTTQSGQIYGGGDAKLISTEEEFDTHRNSNLIVGFDNQGEVISYEVEYLGTGKILGTNTTGECNEIVSYLPCPRSISVSIRNNCGFSVVKPKVVCRTFRYVNGKKEDVDTYKVWEEEWSNKASHDNTVHTHNIEASDNGDLNVYIEPVVLFRLAYKGSRNNWNYEVVKDETNKYFVGAGKLSLLIEGTGSTNGNKCWIKEEPNDGYDHINENVQIPNVNLPVLNK